MMIFASREQTEIMVEALEHMERTGHPALADNIGRIEYNKVLNRLYDILSLQGNPEDAAKFRKQHHTKRPALTPTGMRSRIHSRYGSLGRFNGFRTSHWVLVFAELTRRMDVKQAAVQATYMAKKYCFATLDHYYAACTDRKAEKRLQQAQAALVLLVDTLDEMEVEQ